MCLMNDYDCFTFLEHGNFGEKEDGPGTQFENDFERGGTERI